MTTARNGSSVGHPAGPSGTIGSAEAGSVRRGVDPIQSTVRWIPPLLGGWGDHESVASPSTPTDRIWTSSQPFSQVRPCHGGRGRSPERSRSPGGGTPPFQVERGGDGVGPLLYHTGSFMIPYSKPKPQYTELRVFWGGALSWCLCLDSFRHYRSKIGVSRPALHLKRRGACIGQRHSLHGFRDPGLGNRPLGVAWRRSPERTAGSP